MSFSILNIVIPYEFIAAHQDTIVHRLRQSNFTDNKYMNVVLKIQLIFYGILQNYSRNPFEILRLILI